MKKGHHAGKMAEAIAPVYTIGVGRMFGARRVRERIIARIRKELPIEMESAVRQVLRKVR